MLLSIGQMPSGSLASQKMGLSVPIFGANAASMPGSRRRNHAGPGRRPLRDRRRVRVPFGVGEGVGKDELRVYGPLWRL